MHPKKFMRETEISYQQYQDGLISKSEWLAGRQFAIQEMIEMEILTAKNTLESFGIKVELSRA